MFQESFLEDINCLLNSGEVPDLFDDDEIDTLAMEMKSITSEAGIPDTRTDVFNFFIQVRTPVGSLNKYAGGSAGQYVFQTNR